MVLGSVVLLIPSYLARIMPPGSYTLLTEAWDLNLRLLRCMLQPVVTGGFVDERAWAIACLSVSLGGLGVPALADFADAV